MSPTRERRDRQVRGRTLWRVLLVLAVVVQLVVLYWPKDPGGGGVGNLDKVVHAAVFGAVALAGRGAGVPWRPLALVLVVHAGLSEVIQGTLLPDRHGDPADAVADVTGTVLGLLAAHARLRAGGRRRVPRAR
ncbi:MAG: VanZ family protein [Actinomycetes bacterium]